MAGQQGTILFGQVLVNRTQIFYRSTLSYGLVNLMPIVPGIFVIKSPHSWIAFRTYPFNVVLK